MRLRERQSSRSARLEGWGGHRSRVYPRSASNVRKSGRPDLRCSRRRARGCEIWRTILPAPHHEAGIDRGCIKLIGICFSDYKCPKGAVAAPFGLNTETAQSTFQPEKITLGTAGSPAGFLKTKPMPGAEPDIIILTLSPFLNSPTPWQTMTTVKSAVGIDCSQLLLSTSLPFVWNQILTKPVPPRLPTWTAAIVK